MNDLAFWLELDQDDERYALTGNSTIGRHLDNDLVIAGEDVRDYHARLELTDRGPRVLPLDGATLMVGDLPIEGRYGLIPGDTLAIGHHQLQLSAEVGPVSTHWTLHGAADAVGTAIEDQLLIGRGADCDLQLLEGHVSRQHARLIVLGDHVWLKDLNSSNGSYVNGERVIGACLIFHGDELVFDVSRFQLIGDHPDLTPIRPLSSTVESFDLDPASTGAPVDTAEVTALSVSVDRPVQPDGSGPSLLGMEGGVAGRRFPLQFGRHLIGRAPEVEIHLPEPSVSLRHAEIDVRADGVYVTNLISTNGLRVNGQDVHIQRLEPGDRLELGRTVLLYQIPDTPPEQPGPGTSARTLALAVACAILAGALLWWGFA